MKCLNLFSGKNKTININVSSAKLAQRVLKVKQLFVVKKWAVIERLDM